MKVLTVIALLGILIVPAMAEQTEFYPPGPQDNSWFYESSSNVTVDDKGQVGVAVDAEDVTDYSEISPSPTVPYYGPDKGGNSGNLPLWGNDVLIMSHGLPTLGTITTDQDEQNGDIYTSLLVPHTGVGDTVYTYRSTDGGVNWDYFMVQYGNSSTGGIRDHEILIGHDGSGTWIYSFCLYDGSGSSGGLWVLRERPDHTGIQWTQIVVAGDTLANFSVDRNIENPQHIFVAWQTTTERLDMESSSDYTSSWGNHRNVSSNSRNIAVCAGGDGYVYIVYQGSDTTDIRVARYTNNLISPSFHFETIQSNIYGNFTPSVAAGRTTPGSSQVAWVLYRQMNSIGNASIRYSHTTDGGASWAAGTPWPVTNIGHSTWDMKYPYVRVSYNSTLLRALATIPETGPDSLVYAFSTTSSPTTWEDRGVHNDYSITGEFGARVEYSSDCLGGYLVYRQYASPNAWCDAYDFTGIAEDVGKPSGSLFSLAPNPSKNLAKLTYIVQKEGNVKISLYDATGRSVDNLVNEAKPAGEHTITIDTKNRSAGIYFIKVETPEAMYTKQMTIIK
ncbi:T9SS type A sorting domain-containing protein [candidate division WOR-3 bacterium]|nr:T9SS type A sorting domain-containing protein [candidate division WOR-3 bacterium]MCK4585514.1 T9SS type A sorting domain-containing protein [candidate division WOR-3 bacterium]